MSFLFESHAFLVIVFSAFVLSNGSVQLHGSPSSIHVDALGINREIKNGLSLWGTRRSLLENGNSETDKNYSMILAAERTYRKDPFNGYKYYTGGWDLFNAGYIRSVAYTAVPVLLAAAAWLLGFGLYLLLYCCCCCCCGRKSGGYSQVAYALSIIFLLVVTIGAVFGCSVLYQGQGGFRGSLKGVVTYINKVAEDVLDQLVNLEHGLVAAKDIQLDGFSLPPDILGAIDNVGGVIESSANIPKAAAAAFEKFIDAYLNMMGLFLISVATVMLVLTFLGFFLSILGLRPLVFMLIIIGWILVTVTIILSSVSFLVHNVVADSCIAVDEWLQHPTAHTAVDEILPCYDIKAAETVISQGKNVTHQTVGVINQFIIDVANKDSPHLLRGPRVPLLCDPYNPDNTDRVCFPREVNLKNAPQEWSKHICRVSETGTCITDGRLTPEAYKQLIGALNVTNSVNDLIPVVSELMDCKTVKATFHDIGVYHCPGLRRYSYRIYSGLGTISLAVMLSLFSWIFYGRERHRKRASAMNASTQDLLAAQRGQPYRYY